MAYWLMKSEPDVFGMADLKQRQRSLWDGVRNYQARNFLREMQPGDLFFFYHSSCPEPGIAGVGEIIKAAYTDPSQFNPASPYYDPKSSPDKPRWSGVDVGFKESFVAIIPLNILKAMPALSELALVQKGSRLSVMPVSTEQWQAIMASRCT